jgi:hypothetical protein
MNKTCEVVHVNLYDVHTRSPKAPLQECVRLASIAVGVHWSFSFRFENLNNSQVFRFLQARSLQIIAHKFSYDLCMQSPCLPMSSRQSLIRILFPLRAMTADPVPRMGANELLPMRT